MNAQGIAFNGSRMLGKGGFGTANLVRKMGSNITDRWCAMKIAEDDATYLQKEINNCKLLHVNSTANNINGHFIASDSYIPMFRTPEGKQAAVLISKAGTPMKDGEIYKDYKESKTEQKKSKLISLAKSNFSVQELGLTHRDLKPKNIVKNEDGNWTLIDLGLSESEEKIQSSDGTRRYMAPEVLRFDRDACNAPTDVYSLGLLFAEAIGENRMLYLDDDREVGLRNENNLLLGKSPTEKEKIKAQTNEQLHHQRTEFISEVKKEGGTNSDSPIHKLIAKMIDPDPNKRGNLSDVIKTLEEMPLEAF